MYVYTILRCFLSLGQLQGARHEVEKSVRLLAEQFVVATTMTEPHLVVRYSEKQRPGHPYLYNASDATVTWATEQDVERYQSVSTMYPADEADTATSRLTRIALRFRYSLKRPDCGSAIPTSSGPLGSR
jgi:hypothetical protein